MAPEKSLGEPIFQDDAPLIPPSEIAWSMRGAQMRQQYGGMAVPAGGPQDGQTHVPFADAPLPDNPPVGSDVEGR